MARHRSRSRSRSPLRRKRHEEEPRRERHRERRSPAPSGLLVRNISLSARPEDLRAPFERYGPIKDVYLPKNYYTGESRGFGFVKFRYPEDATEAKNHLDRSVLGGREIRIVFAEENRKTPQEMSKVTRVSSSRGSHRRRSRSMSPRRRRHSYSRSPSPARFDSRNRGHRSRNDHYSPRRPRSVSRSVSPKNSKRRQRSQKHSRSLSRSASPRDDKRSNRRSPSLKENGGTAHAPSRSQSPRRNSKSPVRSRPRSHSPR